MAKETAHQLGTPVSSLEGWVEMLKEKPAMKKLYRNWKKMWTGLRLVSDRFGKIGSTPQLEEMDMVSQINSMVIICGKEPPGKISFYSEYTWTEANYCQDIGPIFDWVIENLLKNALDAMEGKGAITVDITRMKRMQYILMLLIPEKVSANKIFPKCLNPGLPLKKEAGVWG